MLEGWSERTEQYACSRAQLVIAGTAAQPCVAQGLGSTRTAAQAADNAAAGFLHLDEAEVARMRADAIALGDPE